MKAGLGAEYEISRFVKNILSGGEVFLDIGANLGQYSVRLRKKGIKMYLIEPVQANYDILAKYFMSDSDVSVDRFAISDYSGEATLSIPAINGIPIDTQATIDPHCRNSVFKEYKEERVNVTTIDDLTEAKDIIKVDIIKCDTEGNDAKVIMGAVSTISKHHPVIITEDVLEEKPLNFLLGEGYGSYIPLESGFIVPENKKHTVQQGIITDVMLYLHRDSAICYRKFIQGYELTN